MPDLLERTRAYYQSVPADPWRWADDNSVIVWADGSTVAFREELCEILEKTPEAGLPPFRLMSLIALRAEIDAIDDQLVDLLARRQQLVQGAAAFKRDADEVRGADRRRLIMERLRLRAADQGLDPQVVDAVWTAMIDVFVALELSEHARRNG